MPFVIGLAWVMPEAGATGGWLRSEITTRVGVAVIFLLQGLTLASSALRSGAMQWRLHLLVQSFTFVLFPLLGIATDAWVGSRLPPDLRLGFLYLCVLPSTISTSVVLTTIAGGNTAGAIFNAVLSNLLGVFLTPLWMAWLMKVSGRAQPLGPVIVEIVLLLLVPLALGQIVRLARPIREWADGRKLIFGNVSSAIVLFIVFAVFANSVQQRVWSNYAAEVTTITLVGVAGIFVTAMIAVEALARVQRLSRADKIAALFCAPQKTMASGVPMAKIIFGAHPGLGLILLPIIFYHTLQLVVCGLLASRWAHTSRPKD